MTSWLCRVNGSYGIKMNATIRSASAMQWLNQPPIRPVEVCRCPLKPVSEFVSPDFDPLIGGLYFGLLAINKLPLLFFNSDQTLLQLVSSKDNVKWDFIFLRGGKLSR